MFSERFVRHLLVFAVLVLACVAGCAADVEPAPAARRVRSPVSTCRAPSSSAAFHVSDAFPGVNVDQPTEIQHVGGGVYFVSEQGGRIKRIAPDGARFTSSVALDISERLISTGEMGLLGVALSPDFAKTGELFVTYTGRRTFARESVGQTVLSRFVSHDGGRTIDIASEEILLAIERSHRYHNGGRVRFGPDRLLYVSIGDDAWGDPTRRAQNPNELFGKVLRLDVLGHTPGHPYRIPADNPFAQGGGRPEIYALGFRNPWTFSFDPSGRLWLGDVGADTWEELNIVTKGGNYGWPIREGRHCYDAQACDLPGAVDPAYEYPHVDGFSVVSGFVYRGKKLALSGQYVFSDFMTGRVWALDPNAPNAARLLFDSGLFVANFGEDADGELLALDYGSHRVMRIEASRSLADPGPVSLRDLGCLEGDTSNMARGLLPYDIIAPLWSDGLEKRRWVSLPAADTKIHVNDDSTLDFPPGAMLLKEFATGGRRIETRMLVRDGEAGWLGYTFAWNDAQTDAVLLSEAQVVQGAGGPWTIPSRAQCLTCHRGGVLGFKVEQLNRGVTLRDGRNVNQLTHLARHALDHEVDVAAAPSFRDPSGDLGTVEERARAYLNINCATCHNPPEGLGGPDLRASVPLEMMNVRCVPPKIDDLGIPNALLVAPGEPERSILFQRMATTGDARMPRLGSHQIDPVGLSVIRAWIMSLPACP